MIYVLAGTTEGREVVARLQATGYQVAASVVTEYGSSLLSQSGAKSVSQIKFDEQSLQEKLLTNKVSCLIDATHPYATNISQLAIDVANKLNLPYVRYERLSNYELEQGSFLEIKQLLELATIIQPQHKVFSTLGSRRLTELVPIIRSAGAELTVRVLPCVEALTVCEGLGIMPANIVALQGPFTKEMNIEIFKKYNTQMLLTKDSGVVGGVDTKIQAANEMGIKVIMLKRPSINYPCVTNDIDELIYIISKKNINNGGCK